MAKPLQLLITHLLHAQCVGTKAPLLVAPGRQRGRGYLRGHIHRQLAPTWAHAGCVILRVCYPRLCPPGIGGLGSAQCVCTRTGSCASVFPRAQLRRLDGVGRGRTGGCSQWLTCCLRAASPSEGVLRHHSAPPPPTPWWLTASSVCAAKAGSPGVRTSGPIAWMALLPGCREAAMLARKNTTQRPLHKRCTRRQLKTMCCGSAHKQNA